MNKKSGTEKLQRKIFQPSEETEIKINIICELTGMSLSELINSLFDTIGNAEDVVNAYNEAKELYHRKLKCIMSNVLSADDTDDVQIRGFKNLLSRVEDMNKKEPVGKYHENMEE